METEFRDFLMYHTRRLSSELGIRCKNVKPSSCVISFDVLSLAISRDKRLSKYLKPKIQSPSGVYRICADILSHYNNPLGIRMCLVLLTPYIAYAEKHQAPSLWNRVVGRVAYICRGDSYIYTLYALLLQRHEQLTPYPSDVGRLFKKAYYIDKTNTLASRNRFIDKRLFITDVSYFKIQMKAHSCKRVYTLSFLILLLSCVMDFIPLPYGEGLFEIDSELLSHLMFFTTVLVIGFAVSEFINPDPGYIRSIPIIILTLIVGIFISLSTPIDCFAGAMSEILLLITLLSAIRYLVIIQGRRVSENIMLIVPDIPSRPYLHAILHNRALGIGLLILIADVIAIIARCCL